MTTTTEDEEHLLGILVSLLSNLGSDTEPRIRLLAKFVADDYEKVDRLLEIMDTAETRMSRAEAEAAAGDLELDEDEAYLARLEAGLSALQMAAYILAWICMEDDGVCGGRSSLVRAGRNDSLAGPGPCQDAAQPQSELVRAYRQGPR